MSDDGEPVAVPLETAWRRAPLHGWELQLLQKGEPRRYPSRCWRHSTRLPLPGAAGFRSKQAPSAPVRLHDRGRLFCVREGWFPLVGSNHGSRLQRPVSYR